MRRFHDLAFFALVVAICIGCSRDTHHMAPVSGRVTLNGKPLTTGVVATLPNSGRGAKGVINSDGTFTLGTYSTNDGALVGAHKVGVASFDETKGRGPESPNGKLLIPDRYLNPQSSGLTIEVKADGNNTPELKLTSP